MSEICDCGHPKGHHLGSTNNDPTYCRKCNCDSFRFIADSRDVEIARLRAENVRLVEEKAKAERERDAIQGNGPIRLYIALQMLRAWNSGTEGFEALTVSAVNKWIDGGMNGPVPWPDSPFFAEWAEKRGYYNVDGHVGFRCTVTLADAARTGERP